jgi:chlorobactene glucosyltransferase
VASVILFVCCALVVITAVAIINVLMLPRLRTNADAQNMPLISILIPARNEAGVIGHTVEGLLAQTYARFEIIILDDHSTDDTGEIALRAGAGDARVRVVTGAPLPPGWLGKNWACQQLAQVARGNWLLFADADVSWSPDALASCAALMQESQADMLTVWPTQQTVSWAERLVVPLIALAVLGYLPLLLVHHTRWPVFAAANGQCLIFRRATYAGVGGHAAVRAQIVEDVALARLVKSQGFRLRMADGAGQVRCRMYRDWPTVRDGFGKNILAGHGSSLILLGLSAVFHWMVFVLPWLWLPGGGWQALALIVLGVGVRMLTASATRQRLPDALLMPLSVALMTRIAWQAVWWQLRYGGPRWKGRTLTGGRPRATHLKQPGAKRI